MRKHEAPAPHTWRCPYHCGYYRTYSRGRKMYEMIEHPAYGPILNYEAASLDIRNHDCEAYKQSITWLRFIAFSLGWLEYNDEERTRPSWSVKFADGLSTS